MLLSFSFSNFHSFSEPVGFTMSAGSTRKHPSHIREINGVPVLKYSAVYGANASGKSSFVNAIGAARNMVRGEPIGNYSEEHCRSDSTNRDKPTEFEFIFETGGHVYQYGFNGVLASKEFQSEWLLELSPDMKDGTLIYSLEKKDDEICADWTYFKNEAESIRLNQIKSDSSSDDDEDEEEMDAPENYDTLFLSKMKGKKFTDLPNLDVLRTVYKWFVNKLRVNYIPSPTTDEEIATVCKYLARYDTDLMGGEFRFEADISSKAPEDLKSRLKDGKPFAIGNGAKVIMENGAVNLYSIHTRHGSCDADFQIDEESNGTRLAMNVVYNLFCPKEDDATYIIDEFGLAMHPLLVSAILSDYQEFNTDGSGQLIMATHHTSIMSLDALRRDEFWFIEKENGTSRMYSLEDFTERPDAEVAKRYFEGRYGALPVFTELRGTPEAS